MKINVSIIDDHPIATNGIANMLQEYSEINVMGIYHTAQVLLDSLAVAEPDILLLDIILRGYSGKDLVPFIKKEYPNIKIIGLFWQHDYCQVTPSCFSTNHLLFISYGRDIEFMRRA